MVLMLPVKAIPHAIPAPTVASRKKDTELNFSEAMMPAMHRVKATIPIRCAPTGFMRPASDPPIRYGVIMQAKTAAATKVLSVCNCSAAIDALNGR